jgi:hypothetical protein
LEFQGFGEIVGRLDRGMERREGVERNVFLKVYVDWIGYRKFSKTLRTYV